MYREHTLHLPRNDRGVGTGAETHTHTHTPEYNRSRRYLARDVVSVVGAEGLSARMW